MGIYYTSTLTCLDCNNYKSWDTMFPDAELEYVLKDRPAIICGRCNSERIQGSDSCFTSYDMNMDSSEILWEPQNPESKWILPDCTQKLPDVLYLEVNDIRHEPDIHSMISVSISDFDSWTQHTEPSDDPDNPIVEYRRTGSPREFEDLYETTDERYKDIKFRPVYRDIPHNLKPIEKKETDDDGDVEMPLLEAINLMIGG